MHMYMHKHRHVHECASYMRMGTMRNGHGARHAAIRSRDGAGAGRPRHATTRATRATMTAAGSRSCSAFPWKVATETGPAAMDDELFELTRRSWSDSPMPRHWRETRVYDLTLERQTPS